MISFFPTPYPDELWYSVICRYHIRSGNPCIKYTLNELYGTHYYNASLFLCGPVLHLLALLPKNTLSVEQVIFDHTLFPYYARFFTISRKKSSYKYTLLGDSRAIHRLGIYQSKGNKFSTLRYCPLCLQEDFNKYGEPYWHRLHQLPEMSICPRHRCWLVETNAPSYSSTQLSLVPATIDIKLGQSPSTPVPNALLSLNQLIADTVLYPFNFKDGSIYHTVLDKQLRAHGWRSITGGRTYASSVESALLSFFGDFVPASDISTKQLHATLSTKSVSPRYILEVAAFFNLTLPELIRNPVKPSPNYRAEMKELYQSGLSMYHLAKLYGIDCKTVARYVK